MYARYVSSESMRAVCFCCQIDCVRWNQYQYIDLQLSKVHWSSSLLTIKSYQVISIIFIHFHHPSTFNWTHFITFYQTFSISQHWTRDGWLQDPSCRFRLPWTHPAWEWRYQAPAQSKHQLHQQAPKLTMDHGTSQVTMGFNTTMVSLSLSWKMVDNHILRNLHMIWCEMIWYDIKWL